MAAPPEESTHPPAIPAYPSGAVFGEEGRRGCLLLAHGMGVSWDYYLPEIRRFTELGYRVFAFSYRGYPGSGGRFRGFPQAARDVAAAIRFTGDGTLPLTLWGTAWGPTRSAPPWP